MGVKRLGDRFIAINLVLEKNIIQIIGVDALKIGSDESIYMAILARDGWFKKIKEGCESEWWTRI